MEQTKLSGYYEALVLWLKRLPKQMGLVFVSTYAFGLAAHLFVYTNLMLGYDVIDYTTPMISPDRFMARLITRLHGAIFTPWMIGLISLAFIALGAYFVCRLFQLQSKVSVVLTCGLMVTFPVVSAVNCFLSSADVYTFALLCACAAAYLAFQPRLGWRLASIPVLVLSLGSYPAYLALCVCLMLLRLILDVFRSKRKAGQLFCDGLICIGILVVGAFLYYGVWQLLTNLQQVDVPVYRGKSGVLSATSGELLRQLFKAYWGSLKYFFKPGWLGYLPLAVQALLWAGLAASAVLLVRLFVRQRLYQEPLRVVILVLTIGLLPLAMNVMYMLSRTEAPHMLMQYAFITPWLFLIVVRDNVSGTGADVPVRTRWLRGLCALLTVVLSVTIYHNTVVANATYTKLSANFEAGIAYLNRVVDRVETTEGYRQGETEVCFVNIPDGLNSNYVGYFTQKPGFDLVNGVMGVQLSSSLALEHSRTYLIQKVLGVNMAISPIGTEQYFINTPDVQALDPFPAQNCYLWFDGLLIFKLGY